MMLACIRARWGDCMRHKERESECGRFRERMTIKREKDSERERARLTTIKNEKEMMLRERWKRG